MFIDVHVHPDFYEEIQQSKSHQELRHESLGIFKNGFASHQHLLNQMHCAGLDRMCLWAQDYSEGIKAPLVSNEEVALLASNHPEQFWGIASVDPRDPHAVEKLEYAYAKLELKGLALHLGRLQMDPLDDRLIDLYDICLHHNRPIFFQCGMTMEKEAIASYTHPLQYEPLLMRFDKLRVCLTQVGWPWVKETAMLLLKYPQAYTDTALLYFDSAQEFYTEVFTRELPLTWLDRSLRHQVMFGSANPRFEQIRMARALKSLGLRESTLELIQAQNALEFFGMKAVTSW